jgi:two-component system, LytTR family, sensor kinase
MKNRQRIIETFIHIIIWSTGYLLIILMAKTLGPFKRVEGTLILPVTIGTLVNLILFYVTSLILIPRISEKKRNFSFILLLMALYITLSVAETIIDSIFFTYYYSNRPESFYSQLILNFVLNGIILSLALAYGLTKTWLKNEKLRQTLKQEKLKAELNYLKTQLNPHFLFNVLNMAYSSATRNRDERTADIIEKLSGLMRYMLYESNVDRIELEKEVEYITNYINLQKMRFPDDMPVKIDFVKHGNFSNCRLAPLILIQFIENAFKFGVSFDRESEIKIFLGVSDQNLEFRITNPVSGNSSAIKSEASGIGIGNVRKRLDLLYPGKHKLNIFDSPAEFKVELFIKLD